MSDYPGFPPSRWLILLGADWRAQQGTFAQMTDRGASPEDAAAGLVALEREFILKAALHHCQRPEHGDGDVVAVAIDYLCDAVTTGVCLDAKGAREAVAGLLRAGSRAHGPEELMRQFYGGELPADAVEHRDRELIFPGPTSFSPAMRPIFESLVARCNAQIESVRCADGFDEWFACLTRAVRLLTCVGFGLELVTAETVAEARTRMPLGVKVFCAQNEELIADYPAFQAAMALAGRPDITPVVEYSRGMMEEYREQGDREGERFARERLLLPRGLLDAAGAPHAGWRGPGWLTVSLWPQVGMPQDLTPERSLVVQPTNPQLWERLHKRLREDEATVAAELVEYLAAEFAAD
ncbi:hypothetical protein [Actinomadura terrae]|uniref:hypothetical protein n=1 Tax=Actinomadura terrae TaxID=604353 RepID=UPI001FA71AA0|nr:hypothetical protein [Actinomadura terrae]